MSEGRPTLEHKITAPALPDRIDRPRLTDRALGAQLAVLVAPAGHGKTCLAAQIGAAGGGPTAWFTADELDHDATGLVVQLLAALGRAWPDLAGPSLMLTDDEAVLPLLAATLDTLAGPGCVVLDNAHLMREDLLDAMIGTALATLPSACRLVVCTRGELIPAALRAEAAGRAAVLGPGDLAFTADECARVCGIGPAEARDRHVRTGGWPLAVALSGRTGPGQAVPARLDALADMALAELPPVARGLLTVVARLPRFPVSVLRGHGVDDLASTHPGLVQPIADGWYALRVWLRDALGARPADPALVTEVVGELQAAGDRELAAHLLLAAGRPEEAVPEVEQLAAGAAREGRWGRVRPLVAGVPAGARSLELDFLAVRAAGVLDDVDEAELIDVVDRARRAGPSLALRAQAALADHYRMAGDLRFLEVCESALGDTLAAEDPEDAVLRRWPGSGLSDDDAAAAAEILRFYGLGLLFAADWQTVERGRRLVAASFAVAGRVGRSVVSQQAWFLYVEALVYLRPAADVVPRITAAIRRLQEVGHGEAAVRLAELAVLQYSSGDHAAARRTVEIGMEWTDRTGYRIARPPLCAVDVALDVAEGGFTPERAARYDDVLVDMASQARLSFYVPAYAAEFGILLVARGAVREAWRYLEQAEELAGSNLVAHLSSQRSRRLRGLLYAADGRPDEGRAVLEQLRRDAVDERRAVLVELVDADLARRDREVHTTPAAVLVQVLGPQLTATVDGEPVPSLRGYPAKLLALLVASGGVTTMDAAIEGLWPGADPDVGRNRLHGVLLRLRRSLGLPVTGPIACADGVVRLDRDGPVVVDSWGFEDAAATGSPGGWDAVRRFPGEVLSHQFAYDDTIEAYRRALRSTFLRLASNLLADPPGRSDPEDVVALAQRAWRVAPDDESLCLLAVDALLGHGRKAEARELVRGTEQALADLGLDPSDFSRAAGSAFV